MTPNISPHGQTPQTKDIPSPPTLVETPSSTETSQHLQPGLLQQIR